VQLHVQAPTLQHKKEKQQKEDNSCVFYRVWCIQAVPLLAQHRNHDTFNGELATMSFLTATLVKIINQVVLLCNPYRQQGITDLHKLSHTYV
jgi:hypothetical protein